MKATGGEEEALPATSMKLNRRNHPLTSALVPYVLREVNLNVYL